MNAAETALTVVYFAGVLGSVAFVIRRLLTRFWKWPEGMALLLQHVSWVGLGALTVGTLVYGQGYWGQIPLSFLALLGFGAGVWWLTYLQERAQRRGKREAENA